MHRWGRQTANTQARQLSPFTLSPPSARAPSTKEPFQLKESLMSVLQ